MTDVQAFSAEEQQRVDLIRVGQWLQATLQPDKDSVGALEGCGGHTIEPVAGVVGGGGDKAGALAVANGGVGGAACVGGGKLAKLCCCCSISVSFPRKCRACERSCAR